MASPTEPGAGTTAPAGAQAAGPGDEPPVILSPATGYPTLDDGQLATLRQIGDHWESALGPRRAWVRALPLDPNLSLHAGRPVARGRSRFVPVVLEGVGTDHPQTHEAQTHEGGAHDGRERAHEVEATRDAGHSPTPVGRTAKRLRRVLLGPALHSAAVTEERMRKLIALPVLSSDALSSVAYGPEAMLVILVLGGAAALRWSLPVSAAIVVLMVAVGLSYRQTIRAYPRGGGSYIVASDNLGRVPGLTAAAGLMLDYILTVAVSVASGIAAVTSAIPTLRPHPVILGLGVIVLLVAGNLRGIRQAGAMFAAPTYMFIAAILLLVAVGVADAAGRSFAATPRPPVHAIEGVGLLLVLRAFSSGATAMTGIEAISDGIPAFKHVEWRNARVTLTWMVSLLVVMFAGTIALIQLDGIVPQASQTALSQLAHRHLGAGVLYGYVQTATALVLLLAANTAFSDFPRLLFFLARDYSAPRLFLRLGDRLAFSNGIVLLGTTAGVILAAFSGSVDKLIPLFAVGVFLAFTLSQTGMVLHWWRRRGEHWRRSISFNAAGAVLSAIVLVITSITKFTQGAWLVVILVPSLVLLFLRIRVHYLAVGRAVALHPLPAGVHARVITPPTPPSRDAPSYAPELGGVTGAEQQEAPDEIRNFTVVPIVSMDLASLRALSYATSLGQPVLAIHISTEQEEAERFRSYWNAWGDHVPLEIIVSPYRALVAPIARYLKLLHDQVPEYVMTVVMPELVVRHAWHRVLHNGIAPRLRRALRSIPGIIVTTVPFHLPS
ncbi:MAG TPA: APC family permease [Solirubrobacteraceae bacterium]|nr:APC family permease [Solirubrobacteraceae bacterium]